MTSDLAPFADRVRAFIAASVPVAGRDNGRKPDSELETRNPNPNPVGGGDAAFAALALELFALQFTHNPAYRKMCAARHVTPLTLTDWAQIPAVPTAAFKELEITCLAPAERTHVFHSSGTTEQRPSRHFHCAASLAVYEASLWAGLAFGYWPSAIGDSPLAILTPPPTQAPHSSLVHMFDCVRRRLGLDEQTFCGHLDDDGAWALDLEQTFAALRSAESYVRPLHLLGTAFSFVHLLDALAALRLRFQLPPGSCVLETGGYKGRSRALPKAELHALLTQRLGVPPAQIICEYGMSELSSQAYDAGVPSSEFRVSSSPRAFRFPPWARAQVVSPETGREVADGETGLLRVFDLANVCSVLAIQTEDLAVRRGTGSELLGRAALAEPRGCSLQAA